MNFLEKFYVIPRKDSHIFQEHFLDFECETILVSCFPHAVLGHYTQPSFIQELYVQVTFSPLSGRVG